MAKKRSTRKSSKKTKNKPHNIISFIKQALIRIAIVLMLTIGVMFVSDLFSSYTKEEEKKQAVDISTNNQKKKTVDTSQKKTKKLSSSEVSVKSVKIPTKIEIPQLIAKRKEQIIEHEGYTVSYNSDYRIANWVA
ncbi:MAG: DNA/RNA non-specific endonuclease, partial [Parabacteroides sp.]|nr:DNA/RNA non-specific endonuclease [Parabacteroides sp.]